MLRIVLCLSLLLSSTAVWANGHVVRPQVGVVLGGGGAKGAAHIGVLKALEELNVPVDYIVGASMGAYIGGLYATGMSADEIDLLFQNVHWQEGFKDKASRSTRYSVHKHNEDRYQVGFNLGFDDGRFQMPKGVIQGQTMAHLLRLTVGYLPDFDHFDQLAIPYRAVATDMATLEPVVLASGSLARSMQASMAIQGMLAPVEIGGQLLADGGLVNNLPIAVVKKMGADIVIAVDISNDFSEADDLSSYLAMMDQVTNYVVQNNTQLQQSLLSRQDVLIRPQTQHIGITNFAAMSEAYGLGYTAAQSRREALSSFSVSAQQYQTHRQMMRQRRNELRSLKPIVVDRFELDNDSYLSDNAVLKQLRLRPNWPVDFQALETGIQHLYAMDRFERVDYHLYQQDEQQILKVIVREKSWGPNYIDFRFAVEDNFTADTDLSMGMAINLTGLSAHGAEWRNEFELGTSKGIRSVFYSPFDTELPLFLQLEGEYNVTKRNASLPTDTPSLPDTERFFSARFESLSADASLGYALQPWFTVRSGVRVIDGEVYIPGQNEQGVREQHSQSLYLDVDYDTRDDHLLPTRGISFNYLATLANNSAKMNGESVSDSHLGQEVNLQIFHAYRRHTVGLVGEWGKKSALLGLPLEPFELGGFMHLSGIPKGSLLGSNKVFAALNYRYLLAANDFGLFTAPIFIGGGVERGGVWNGTELNRADASIYNAANLYTGIKTPFGPVMLGYGLTEQGYDSFYLMVGNRY
ncbi:patatin-like phospholipase family protein [Thaumasiovibrio sp. DFM-14]|uniref:patatin-like phospholipase family protein n=1 Tax=Thaumasiovibrio sp. DFM-14 TaxID=3384792 RepID=UPI00399FF18A